MGWTWIPDNPMVNYPTSPTNNGPSLQDIIIGQSFMDDLKKKLEEETKKKKDEEKKKKAPEMPKFSFGETFFFVLFFSIPITLLQLNLLQYVQTTLNGTFK